MTGAVTGAAPPAASSAEPGPTPAASVAPGLAPWLAPYRPWVDRLRRAAPQVRLRRLDALARSRGLRTESGLPLRFVAADAAGSVPYETWIHAHGEVPTRTTGPGAMHDLFNALAWLRFPRAKARLNALQAAQIARHGIGATRGGVRDAATLLDESGALWLCDDPALDAALRAFDWHRLFVRERDRVRRSVTVLVLGHALLEKLDAPYKAVTAHALPLALPADAGVDRADALLAETLAARLPTPRDLCPLPVLGLPGWCPGNEDPGFYDDAAVFRPGRSSSRRVAPPAYNAPQERGGRSPARASAPEEGPDSGGQGAG